MACGSTACESCGSHQKGELFEISASKGCARPSATELPKFSIPPGNRLRQQGSLISPFPLFSFEESRGRQSGRLDEVKIEDVEILKS
jgi:hypothetical protein